MARESTDQQAGVSTFRNLLRDFNQSASQSHLESAEDGGHSFLQAVPPLVPLMDQDFQLAGIVGPILPSKAAVLFVDQFQLGQALMDLPLEGL